MPAPRETVREVDVAADSPWFEGHFDGAPVLPAIGLLSLVSDALEEAAGEGGVVAIDEIRFASPIGPGSRATIRLGPGADDDRWTFVVTSGGETCASGRLRWRRSRR